MKRDIFADRLKGYACFLVVFGHVIMGIRLAGVDVPRSFPVMEKFIWSFHVSLFLFLSGYVYRITGGKQRNKMKFIMHKLINLGIPYIIFSIVYILINNAAGEVNTRFSLYDILTLYKTPVAQYWFLYALFFLFCIWTALADVLKNWQITLIMLSAGYIVPILGGGFGAFDIVVYSAFAFGLGTFADISRIKGISLPLKILFILCHVIIGIIFAYCGITDKPVIKELTAVFGIYSSILFVSCAEKCGAVKLFLDFMSKYSFQIYLLHTIFTAGIRAVLLRIGITQWSIHIVCGLMFGIVMPFACAAAAEKIRILNICFFPEKTVREIFWRN